MFITVYHDRVTINNIEDTLLMLFCGGGPPTQVIQYYISIYSGSSVIRGLYFNEGEPPL